MLNLEIQLELLIRESGLGLENYTFSVNVTPLSVLRELIVCLT